MDRFVASLTADLRLDPFGLFSRYSLDRIPRRPLQEVVLRVRDFIGQLHEIGHRVAPEDEADITRLIPAVEMCSLGEVGVSAQGDTFKTGLAAQSDHLVQSLGSVLVRGT